MTNTRKEILDMLAEVFVNNGYASLLLRGTKIPEQETAFAAEVLYGTIRNYSLLEKQWRPYVKKVKKRTALLLDMTVYQMFFMNAADYAAVSEAVELAPKAEKGFVNAVLRSVQKAGLQIPEGDSVEEIAERTSHPLWILKMWEAHYGHETMKAIAEEDQRRASVYGRWNPLKVERSVLEEDPKITFLDEYCLSYDGVLSRSEYFRNGQIIIQDMHSQKVAGYLDVQPGMCVLDMCAAPGTKTQQIAALIENRGEITACDLHAHRTKLIEDMMEKTGVTIVKTVHGDMTVPGQFPEGSFDRILLDAPCSGLGDLSHKPEIRWHLKPENIDELCETQSLLLSRAAEYLKKEGILVYSTCTLNRKENENRIRSFLEKHPEFTLLEEKTMFPGEGHADGFYAAKLMKLSRES